MAFRKGYTQDGAVRLLRLRGGSAPNVVPASAEAELACPAEMAADLEARSTGRIRYTPISGGVRIEASGVSAHGSTPEQGENAIGRLMQALAQLPLPEGAMGAVRFLAQKIGMESDGSSLGIDLHDDVSGGLTLNLGTLQGDESGLQVRINYRYPVTASFDACAPAMQQAFEAAGFQMTEQTHKASLYVPEDSGLVQTLLQVYTEQTGFPAKPKAIGGGTYAKTIPNIVAFGPIFPGDEIREHKPDEFIEIDKLMQNMQIFAEAMYRLAK